MMLLGIRNAQDVLSTCFIFSIGIWGIGIAYIALINLTDVNH